MSTATANSLEARALSAEKSVDASGGAGNAALHAAIASADLYMQALRLSDDVAVRKRLDAKARQLLSRAEAIKAQKDGKIPDGPASSPHHKHPQSARQLTTREQIILLEGAKLNGSVFKPWSGAPNSSEFNSHGADTLYTEPTTLTLSAAQERALAGWERPKEALRRIQISKDGNPLANVATMVPEGKIDLVQDMASDCSVVASLCAGTARMERGHSKMLGTILFPYDHERQHPYESANGHYILRLYFNGCWRRVDIDDRLPASRTERLLHVVNRAQPGLLWPALVEKGYLKVRGGYDFPGSNSGTDLAVLSGWIPQQVFLHDEDIDRDSLWAELLQAHERGDVLITIGTGKLARQEQRHVGLAPEHDYSVLELKESDGINEMLIKNPWSSGDVWKGASRRRPNPNLEHEEHLSLVDKDTMEMMPGTFWMSLDNVFLHFEHLYINWNPSLFASREDLHFSWNVTEVAPISNIFVDNPQFAISTVQAGEVWILLNRHFRTGDYTHKNSGNNGFISLYLYDKQGFKVLSTEGALLRGPFVDSPNTLMRFDAQKNTTYSVVAVAQDLVAGKHNFTVSVLGSSPVTVSHAAFAYPHHNALTGAWTRSSAGGNSDSIRYLDNPQFCITVEVQTPIALLLRLIDDGSNSSQVTNIHVKLLLLHSPASGKGRAAEPRAHRVLKLRTRDVVTSSGDYRRGSAVIESSLAPGSYVVICSTFDQHQVAKFCLDLHSAASQALILQSVPAEHSGRLNIYPEPAIFAQGARRIMAKVHIPTICRAVFIGRMQKSTGSNLNRGTNSPALFRLALEQNPGPYAKTLASSAEENEEFSSVPRINDIQLTPGRSSAGLYLVVERPSQATADDSGIQGLDIEILCEERIQLSPWEVLDS